MPYRAYDVMGFGGGFTLGMVQAGFELAGKRELPGGFGVANCEANRHLLGDNWHTQVGPAEEWDLEAFSAEVVFGNPPCSGFSAYTPQAYRGVESQINACMWSFAGAVAKAKPLIAIMESVRQAFVAGRGLMLALREHIEQQTGLRYEIHHVYQNAIELGGAGKRPRYFFVLSRIPFAVDYPEVRQPTLADVIGDLATLTLQPEAQVYRKPPSWWAYDKRGLNLVVDGHAMSNAAIVRRSMNVVEELKRHNIEFGQGQKLYLLLKQFYETHGFLPDPFYQSRIDHYVACDWTRTAFGFAPVIRWKADAPTRVVHGRTLESVFHPTEQRFLTHREVARIMGFPDSWKIEPMLRQSPSALVPTWGKGITVQCGSWIGRMAKRALDNAGRPVHEWAGNDHYCRWLGFRELFWHHDAHRKSDEGVLCKMNLSPSGVEQGV